MEKLRIELEKWTSLLEDSSSAKEVTEAYAMIDFLKEEIKRQQK